MLNKLRNRPAWYKIWAIIVAMASIYLLIRLGFAWFYVEDFAKGLLNYDYFIMSAVFLSLLADLFLAPVKKSSDPE